MTDDAQLTWSELIELVRKRRNDYHTRTGDDCPACDGPLEGATVPEHMRSGDCEATA